MKQMKRSVADPDEALPWPGSATATHTLGAGFPSCALPHHNPAPFCSAFSTGEGGQALETPWAPC